MARRRSAKLRQIVRAQLGTTASRHGTGDIAKDTDAVRAALGYDKVDYHGGSYGGEDVTA
jgi:pimeloyl-ACP methyl ester carboxylesterase